MSDAHISSRMRITSVSILLFVIVYWIVTFFFVLPSNYLNVQAYRESKFFDLFLFQRWGFFAPPPTFNDRLYYTYYDKNKNKKQIRSYEILENIYSQKQKQAPFNKKDEIMDYVISNTVNSLLDFSREANNLIEYDSLLIPEHNNSNSKRTKFIINEIEARHGFKTLANYGRILAKENGIKDSGDLFQIKITRISIPQFEDRYKQGSENLFFVSNIHKL